MQLRWEKYVVLMGILCTVLSCGTTDADRGALMRRFNEIAAGKSAQIGVAVIMDGTDTLTFNNDTRYPMLSVFKLHQAVAAIRYCGKHNLPLETPIRIMPDDLPEGTHSPLRDKYPQGDVELTIRELMEYTLQLSDNNACDILFQHTGGVVATDAEIRSLGLDSFAITATERDMHADWRLCYDNWTTPLEAAKLVDMLFTRRLADKAAQDFIINTMKGCTTGNDRLAAPLLHTPATIGHKTGSSGTLSDGLIPATNDVGFVLLPDGRRYSIAVFVKDSREDAAITAGIIADISEAVYRYAQSR